MIALENVSRSYGQVVGVYNITCHLDAPITALLGPNGAGKSTLIKMFTGQMRPTTGKVRLFGEEPFANPSVMARIGYCSEQEALYEEMTGREFLEVMGGMCGLGSRLSERVAYVLDEVGMADRANVRIAGCSKGMRQRLKVAQAMLHEPQLLILDEPLNGLDPVGRRHLSDVLLRFAERGGHVLISSHVLHEVEQLTRHIVLIHRGRLLAQGDVYKIRSLIDQHPHRIAITTSDARALARAVMAMDSVMSARLPDTSNTALELEARNPEKFYDEFPQVVLEQGVEIHRFESPDNNLEAVFNYLVRE